jgi:hypothetical protein
MLMIDKRSIREDINALKQKLASPSKKAECVTDIEKIIDMKQSHLWRADLGSCSGNICNISPQIEIEMGILQDAVEAIKGDDNSKAVSLLENYVAFIEENYEDEHPTYQ